MITIEFKNYDDMVAFARALVRDLGEYAALKELVSCPGKYRAMLEGKPVQVATMAQPQAAPAPQVSQVQPQQATPAPQVMAAPPQAQTPPVQAMTQSAPVTQVQTSTPSYTLDDISRAATTLMDAGRQGELIKLLRQFGIATLPDLPKEQYGAFATALRGMGAQI